MKQRERLDKMQPTDCETKVEIDSTNEKKKLDQWENAAQNAACSSGARYFHALPRNFRFFFLPVQIATKWTRRSPAYAKIHFRTFFALARPKSTIYPLVGFFPIKVETKSLWSHIIREGNKNDDDENIYWQARASSSSSKKKWFCIIFIVGQMSWRTKLHIIFIKFPVFNSCSEYCREVHLKTYGDC